MDKHTIVVTDTEGHSLTLAKNEFLEKILSENSNKDTLLVTDLTKFLVSYFASRK